ncbi:hypothetical protein N7492_001105 [Penicillium capsulatum]|uniref:DUF3074 domain-containing protein n=1 Tax=Penicillium capsulatum TaxID=69766 RepID=A0A9W9M018_9EURO|nr:hypothetical protein N7492_001105 [Penicillium capsulatum]KAJ6129837.1 hypothetical protein N7512_002617 [Penicillium capsulatum]
MTSLHEALQCLKPTSWDTVPQSPGELREYMRDIFKQSRLIAESLPDPPPYENQDSNGADPPPEEATPRVVPSPARVGEIDAEITSMQKEWGKPIKVGGPKENPLGVHVWKLSANDGGGSWFGRRSVHAGLPYERWQTKMASEYDETLKVNRKKIEKGQTPDKAIRGIGAEEKVETVEVKDEDGSVMGQVMLYHVSAQFPKPTAPRDFVALIITSEAGLRIGGSKQPGRSWMMISRPCEHPDVPQKQGYTRGGYESIEIIREIPRKRDGGSSNGESADKPDGSSEDNKMDPVEWIMVTRSDPGGSIPRWMVDKGTPRSVGTDAAKFVDWAVQDDKPRKQADCSSGDSGKNSQGNDLKSGDSGEDSDEGLSDSDSDISDSDVQSHHGLIASVTGLINTGYERFAPHSFLGYGAPQSHEQPGQDHPGVSDEQTSKSPSSKPLGSKQLSPTSAARAPDQASLSSAHSEVATPLVNDVVQNNIPPAELIQKTKDGKLSSHEKELAKLALRKREIESKLETIRSGLENLQLPSQSAPATPSKEVFDMESDQSGMLKRAAENRSSTPASSGKDSQRESSGSVGQPSSQAGTNTPTQDSPAQNHKATSQLFHEESKLLKQLRKVEGSQLKVATKIEARQRKEAERSEKSRSRSEAEGLRQEVKDLKKEVNKLRSERQKWVDLVASLQAENTKLTAQHERS